MGNGGPCLLLRSLFSRCFLLYGDRNLIPFTAYLAGNSYYMMGTVAVPQRFDTIRSRTGSGYSLRFSDSNRAGGWVQGTTGEEPARLVRL